LPQPAQKQMPVSSVGPFTMRGAVSAGTAGLEERLHSLELGRLDDGRHHHLHHLGVWLALARLPELLRQNASDRNNSSITRAEVRRMFVVVDMSTPWRPKVRHVSSNRSRPERRCRAGRAHCLQIEQGGGDKQRASVGRRNVRCWV
jgi:hypothetical protein